jgi:hypothetical protein
MNGLELEGDISVKLLMIQLYTSSCFQMVVWFLVNTGFSKHCAVVSVTFNMTHFSLSLFFLIVLGFELRASCLGHLSDTSSPFCFSYFSDRISCFGWGWPEPWLSYLHLLSSWYYTHISTTSCLFVEMGGVLLSFCPCWPWLLILPVSASWIARITSMRYLTWPQYDTVLELD